MKDNWDSNWSKYIKSTLDDYHPPVPDSLWNNLESKIPVAKKSIFFTGKFFSRVIFSIALVVGIYFLYTNNDKLNKTKVSEQLTSNNSIEINKTTQLNSLAENSNIHTPVTETKKTQSELSTVANQLNAINKSIVSEFKETVTNSQRTSEPIINQRYLKTTIVQPELPIFLKEMRHKHINIKHKKKRTIKKEFNIDFESGIQSIDSWSFITGIHAEYNWNRLGIYGGMHYSPHQLREFISGEGAENSTVKVLTADKIQHRINFFSGVSFHAINTKDKRISANAGILSKTISLNGSSEFYTPLMISTGIKVRLPFLRKYNTSIYYNYLFNLSNQKSNGHQVGIRFQLYRQK
jgi:hypothetical protein